MEMVGNLQIQWGKADAVTMRCRTRILTRTLMGFSEDTHTRMSTIMVPTVVGWLRRCKAEVRTVASIGRMHPIDFHRLFLREREGDRGSRVTLVGLGANVLLTSAKGAAGWFMNSAALLADAGHSLSGKLDH
jgi:hypothetical protein